MTYGAELIRMNALNTVVSERDALLDANKLLVDTNARLMATIRQLQSDACARVLGAGR